MRTLFDGSPKVGVGIYDGLSALVARNWKFDFLWVSSFSCSAAAGLPDAGIIGPDEILATVRTVRRLTSVPVVVDLDAGYGDPLKIFHVVEGMVRAGAAALSLEDNPTSKRCSLYPGHKRTLAPREEHSARLRAALEAVKLAGSSCHIIARTEALVAGLGLEEALERANAYVEAGAHAIFVQSLDATGNEVLEFARKWKRRRPIFIAPTRFPQITRKQFIRAGISHQIFANHGLRAAHAALEKTFQALARAQSSLPVERNISPVATVAQTVGAELMFELEARFQNGKQNGGTSRRNGARRASRTPSARGN